MTGNSSVNNNVIEYFTSRAGEYVKEPAENDVVIVSLQQQQAVVLHKGNQRLLQDVTDEYKKLYQRAMAEKNEVVHQLLIQVKDRSGHFLKEDEGEEKRDGGWCIQNYEQANLYVSHLLNETIAPPKLIGNSSSTTTNGNSKNTRSFTPRRGTPHQQSYSTEYREACQTLSDDTMNQACELLLMNTTSTSEQLLQIYVKCVHAAHIIETEAHNHANTTAMFPLPPPISRGRVVSTTTNAVNGTATNGPSKSISTKTGVPPANKRSRIHSSKIPQHQRSMMSQGNNNNNIHSNNNTTHPNGVKKGSVVPTKKLKRAPSPPSSLLLVPENALQFLAKLNNQQTDGYADTTNKNDKEQDNDQNDIDMDYEQSMDTKTLEMEPLAPPARVQPTRSSKKS